MEQADTGVVMKPKSWLTPSRQRRTRDDEAGLTLLGANIAAIGFLNAIVALPSGEIIAGHRRYQAIMLREDITDVPVRIVCDPLTARDIRVRRISENLQRSDLSFYDKYLECRGFREEEPGITAKEIAALLHVDNSTITRYLCLDFCIEAVRRAAMDDAISMKAAYELSKAPQNQQECLLAEALEGGAERVSKARRKAVGTVPTAKANKIKYPLPSGQVVTIAGEDITLDECIDVLKDALKGMVKARDTGLDCKTAMAYWKDVAAAGS